MKGVNLWITHLFHITLVVKLMNKIIQLLNTTLRKIRQFGFEINFITMFLSYNDQMHFHCNLTYFYDVNVIGQVVMHPPNSSRDPKVSPKTKQWKKKRVKARSLTCNILGVRGRAQSVGWD
jgi:hypothetical protein